MDRPTRCMKASDCGTSCTCSLVTASVSAVGPSVAQARLEIGQGMIRVSTTTRFAQRFGGMQSLGTSSSLQSLFVARTRDFREQQSDHWKAGALLQFPDRASRHAASVDSFRGGDHSQASKFLSILVLLNVRFDSSQSCCPDRSQHPQFISSHSQISFSSRLLCYFAATRRRYHNK